MIRKKKVLISIAIVATVVTVSGIAIAISGLACQWSPVSDNFPVHGFKYRSRGIPPFMHDEIGKFILWRMEQMADTLNLTSSQRDHFDELKTNVESVWKKGLQTKGQLRKNTVQELEKPTPDLSVVTSGIQEQLNKMTAMLNTNLTLFNTFYNSLNADQKKTLNQKVKKRFDSHKEFRSLQK